MTNFHQNWFQNRRAKAKQQKRQEEFEKMQKAKAEAEEAARDKSDTAETVSKPEPPSTSKEEPEKAPTPKETPVASTSASKATGDVKANKQHKKTKSESAREATFASLQRALNAACAARDRFTRRDSKAKEAVPEEEPISPTSMAPPSSATKTQENKALNSYQDWPEIKDETTPWTSSHGQNASFAAVSFPADNQAVPDVPISHSMQNHLDAYSTSQFSQNENWAGNSNDQIGLAYSDDMHYSMPTQTPDISVTRRDSSTALNNSLNGIGICNADSGLPQSSRVGASWKEAGKELDLAARRKRPRPAAIGTSNTRSLAASTSMSSLSPTSRMPSFGAGNAMRHSKSTQSLNSRYAGVRKSSAAQRSPLNFTFAESGTMTASKANMLRPSVSSTSLAPPTPLTPQDFQHFMPPASPTDSYCLSAHSTTHFFPSSQPIQVNIASPPSTPLDIYAPFSYQGMAPPLSAPAHVTTFPEYVSCDPVPMTARSWAESGSLASPDFPGGLPVSQPGAALGFDAAVEHPGQAFGMDPVSESPSLLYSMAVTDMSGAANGGDGKPAEFMMHDYSEQDTHHFNSQHLPLAQRSRAYSFSNNTTAGNYPS